MTRKSIFLITLFVLGLNSASFGQVTKLEAWQPQIIKDNNGNPTGIGKGQEWQTWCEEKLKTDGIGQNTGTVWIVRSDRDNNPTYSSPSLSNPTGKTLKFGDQLYVAKYENGFAYVFSTPKTVAPNTPIPPSSNFMGWVPISNLLLWENCPKNRSQIARKALVVYDPAGSSSNDEGPVEEPRFFNAPGTDASISNYKANSLDVLFVLKKVEIEKKTYYLLSTQNTIRGRADLKGWLPSEYVTPWDHRLALEPTSIPSIVNNFKSKGLKPVAYSRLENAVTFFNNATIGNPLYKYDNFSSERMDPYVMRMPIIDSTPYKQINKIAVTQALSEAGKPTGGRGYELSRAETQRTISELHEKQKNINIVFVVDAGRSLNNFYPHLANAIKAVGGNNFFNNPEISSSINIGLVTYGNASDEIEYYKLSHDVQPLVSKINGIEVTEVDTGSRALFLGLETALDCRKMNYSPDHSNFIILIGNTCNSNTDANGRHWTEACTRIADKMFDNRINFLAYQIIGDYSEPGERDSEQPQGQIRCKDQQR